MTSIGANIFAARYLARQITQRRWIWWIVASAFAAAPSVTLRLNGHYALAWIFPLALVVAEMIHVLEFRQVRFVRLGIFLAFAGLCSSYFLIPGLMIVGGSVLALLVRREQGTVKMLVRLAGSAVILLLVMSPFLIERVRFDRREEAAGRSISLEADYRVYSADAAALVAQPDGAFIETPGSAEIRSNFPPNVLEATIFPGYLLLAGLGALALFRSRLRVPWVLTAMGFWFLTIGPEPALFGRRISVSSLAPVGWAPFEYVKELPFLTTMRTPNRVSYGIAAIGAGGLALLLTYLAKRSTPRQQLGLFSVCLLALCTSGAVPLNRSSLPFSASTRQGLTQIRQSAAKGESVVKVPSDCFGNDVGADSAAQLFHRSPAVGCQIGYLALPWWSGMDLYVKSKGLASLRCNAAAFVYRVNLPFGADTLSEQGLSELRRDFGARYFIIDENEVNAPGCQHLAGSGLDVLRQYKVLSADGATTIIDTGPRSTSSPS